MIPIGDTQANATQGLSKTPLPLPFSVIGEPIPAAHYSRVHRLKKAMFPNHYGPLRGNGGN